MRAENKREETNMSTLEARLKAGKKYKQKYIVNVALQFNTRTEPELTEYVQSLPNKTAYIKGLIRADMERLATQRAERTNAEWAAIVELMDDDLREQVHAELMPCTPEEFLERYQELHEQKYGEPFVFN